MSGLALVHEWLAVRAGSEKTFEAMASAFPSADLYALTWNRDAPFDFGGRPVGTTPIDRSGYLRDHRALALPLMPAAWALTARTATYDTVLTSSHAFSRSFPPARAATHYCYCHAPLRYVWNHSIDVRSRTRLPGTSVAARALAHLDRRTAATVDHFAANSRAVRERIRRFYGRDATVIYPPVDTDYYTLPPARSNRTRALAVSRFIPYKRLDIAIEASAIADVPLTVAGSGPDERRLRTLARSLNADVEFEVSPSDTRLRDLYRSSIALIFPANEDFGIVAIEAQACGAPVVALDAGGACDTVDHNRTGLRVAHQSASSFADALSQVAANPPSPLACRTNAERFSRERFIDQLRSWLNADS